MSRRVHHHHRVTKTRVRVTKPPSSVGWKETELARARETERDRKNREKEQRRRATYYIYTYAKGARLRPAGQNEIAGPQDDGMATVARLTPRSVSIVSWRGNGGGRASEKERERGTQGGGGGNVERVEERGLRAAVREIGGKKGDRAMLGAGRSGRARAIQPPFTFNERARSLAVSCATGKHSAYENRQRCCFRPGVSRLPSPPSLPLRERDQFRGDQSGSRPATSSTRNIVVYEGGVATPLGT